MKKIFITLSALLFITLVNTGCETDEHGVTKNESFTLNFDLGSLNTKATEEETGNSDGDFNENKINTLDIFFYQGSTLKWHISNSGINYDETNKMATIPITSGKDSLFPGAYDIYVVANAGNKTDLTSIAEGQDNLENLKNRLFRTPDFVGKGGSEAQSDFLMDGKISKMIGPNESALGTVEMKRAAAKIRIRLTNVNIPGYTQDGTARARLVHFTDQSALLEGGVATGSPEWQNTSYKNVETTSSGGNGKSTAAPFYAYANDWSGDPALETYIELLIPLKDENMHTNTYKYRIPVTPKGLTGEEAKYRTQLYRNHLYAIDANVKILGGLDEGSVTLDANYTIQDWSTQEVLIDIKGAHYLVVSETDIVMPNIQNS